jgi:hypothetical protein
VALRLDQPIEDRGYFWLPEDPDRKVPGTFRHDEAGGPTLHLDGTLTPLDGPIGQLVTHATIFGVLAARGAVTLEQSFQNNFHINMPGLAVQSLWVSTAYIGHHLPLEERVFDEMLIGCDHLVDWMNLSGHNLEIPEGEQARWRLSYTFPPEITVQLPDDTVIEGTVTNSYRADLERVTSTEDWLLKIRPKEPAHLLDLFGAYGARLRDLLSFATDEPNRVESITVHSERHKMTLSAERARYDDIEVLARLVQPSPTLVRDGIVHQVLQLFTQGEFPGGFAAAVLGWFSVYDQAPEAIALLMALRYQPPFYWPLPLVYTVEALESYHRETMEGDRSAAKQRVAETLAATPEQHRSWLAGRLRNAHEPSLQDRLFELRDRVKSVIGPLADDPKQFVEGAMAARNARAHPGDKTRDHSSERFDQMKLKTQAEWMLIASILLDMGLDKATATNLLATHQPYAVAVTRMAGSTTISSRPATAPAEDDTEAPPPAPEEPPAASS